MINDNKSTEDKKSELIEAGWASKEYMTATGWQPPTIRVGLWGLSREEAQLIATKKAYAHLQERRELETLRAFVLRIHNINMTDDVADTWCELEADELVLQFNITASDEGETA